jgi:hypothetical protein
MLALATGIFYWDMETAPPKPDDPVFNKLPNGFH